MKWHVDLPDKENAVLVFRGPRQVGKTTATMLKIRELLKNGAPPTSICFIACDMIHSAEKLYDYIQDFILFSDSYKHKRRYLFIDEISFVKDWPLAIKRLKDGSKIVDLRLFITGSNTLDLKRGAERLPGRNIEGNEYFIYPLAFSQYLDAFGTDHTTINSPFDLFGEGKMIVAFDQLQKLEPKLPDLRLRFDAFLASGGFLKPVNEMERGELPVAETYLRWIEKDVSAAGRDVRSAQQIIRSIIDKKGSPASLLSIMKQTDLANHNSVKEYVSLLEDMQVFFTSCSFDISKKSLVYRKDKKFNFLDPFIHHACAEWTGTKVDTPQVVESTVAEHLRRITMQNGFEIGYYRDDKSEVDVVLANKKGVLLPVEVKWQEQIGYSDFEPLFKFGFGIVATKKTLAQYKGKYLAIPVALLLSMLRMEKLQRLTYIR